MEGSVDPGCDVLGFVRLELKPPVWGSSKVRSPIAATMAEGGFFLLALMFGFRWTTFQLSGAERMVLYNSNFIPKTFANLIEPKMWPLCMARNGGPSVDVRIHSWPGPTVDVGPSIARPTVDARPTTVGPGHPQSAWVHSWPRTAPVLWRMTSVASYGGDDS